MSIFTMLWSWLIQLILLCNIVLAGSPCTAGIPPRTGVCQVTTQSRAGWYQPNCGGPQNVPHSSNPADGPDPMLFYGEMLRHLFTVSLLFHQGPTLHWPISYRFILSRRKWFQQPENANKDRYSVLFHRVNNPTTDLYLEYVLCYPNNNQ